MVELVFESLPSLLSPLFRAAYEIYNLNHWTGDERLEASARKRARRKNSFDVPLREEIFARRFTDVQQRFNEIPFIDGTTTIGGRGE